MHFSGHPEPELVVHALRIQDLVEHFDYVVQGEMAVLEQQPAAIGKSLRYKNISNSNGIINKQIKLSNNDLNFNDNRRLRSATTISIFLHFPKHLRISNIMFDTGQAGLFAIARSKHVLWVWADYVAHQNKPYTCVPFSRNS